MELNRWYYITYQKKGHKLNIFYDGEKVASDDIGNVQWNDGPIYIGRDPWYNGVAGAGFDNIQIHNRALSEAEIERTAAGTILFNDNLVLALDFAGGVVDGVIHDMSPFLHHAKVHGNPEMVPGGYPEKPYEAPPLPTGNFMKISDGNQYIEIPHSDSIAMGRDNGDFTVSWTMKIITNNGDWRNVFHKGASDGERQPACWRYPGQNGLHARIDTTSGGNQGIDKSTNVEYDRWYHYSYVKINGEVSIWIDGVKDSAAGIGVS